MALKTSGRVAEAIDQYQALLVDQTRVLGSDDPRTESAATIFPEPCRIRARSRGDRPVPGRASRQSAGPGTGSSRHPHNPRQSRAGLRASGWTAEAIDQFQEVIADQTRVPGPDHPDTLMTRGNLAGALQKLGRVSEAIDLFQAVIADQTRILEPDHPDTLITRGNLAVALWDLGRVSEAIDQFQAMLSDCQRVLGPDHPSTTMSRSNLAMMALQSSGRVAGAIGQDGTDQRSP